jgi:transposase
LLWDGLPAHRSRAMRAWLATQRSWLVVERLPAYATELNPTEGL